MHEFKHTTHPKMNAITLDLNNMYVDVWAYFIQTRGATTTKNVILERSRCCDLSVNK